MSGVTLLPKLFTADSLLFDEMAHVVRVTSTVALLADHSVASALGVSPLVALAAEALRAIPNVLVVGQSVDFSTPLERCAASGIADATFPLGLVHRTLRLVQ